MRRDAGSEHGEGASRARVDMATLTGNGHGGAAASACKLDDLIFNVGELGWVVKVGLVAVA